ncbi:MAG: AbrB/MazE/SpoVT family DNA-binding domain-containing protein [archaeon]
MRRRIIRQGNKSFTLTLPIDWIKENGLKAQDEVELAREENSLLVSLPRDYKKPSGSVSVDVSGCNERTARNIIYQHYRKGYDQIILTIGPEQSGYIERIVRHRLMGFEVAETKANQIIIQNIAEPSAERFNIILRKVFLTIKMEADEILADFRKNSAENLERREEQRSLIDSYANVCRRLIINHKIGGQKNSYTLLQIIHSLAHIEHAYYYMYRAAALVKQLKNGKDTLTLLEKSNEMFSTFYEAFYTRNTDMIESLGIMQDVLLFERLYKLLLKSGGPENITLHWIGEIIRMVHLQSILLLGLSDMESLD